MASSLNGTGVTFSNATTQASAWIGGKGQVFTASGTFTIPAGVTAVKVTVVAGGGTGASSSGSYGSGSGGGAGGTAIKFLTGLTPGGTLTVTRGASAGASSVASGTQTITTVSATAGTNGSGGASETGVAGGIGSGGDINQPGGRSTQVNGGYSPFGVGGFSIDTASPTVGSVGLGYGSGGGGGGYYSDGCTTITRAGGAGAAGIIIFEW